MTDSTDQDQIPGDGGWERWCMLSSQAYARYHEQLLVIRSEHPGLSDYAAVERIDAAKGTFAWWWGAAGEVRETINSMNAWGVRLHTWNAWNRVVEMYESEGDRWELLSEFVEPLAFFCMLQPSSLADRITVTGETLLHQANLRVITGHVDALEQDAKPGRPLRRSDRRKQLNRLGAPWGSYPAFRDALFAIDGEDYKKVTRNFRDLTNHSFAPRLMLGEVTRAIRTLVPASDLIEQLDGTYLSVEDPTRKRVQYAMQSAPPLPLYATRAANLAEYQKARRAIEAFAPLIAELCDRIDAMPITPTP